MDRFAFLLPSLISVALNSIAAGAAAAGVAFFWVDYLIEKQLPRISNIELSLASNVERLDDNRDRIDRVLELNYSIVADLANLKNALDSHDVRIRNILESQHRFASIELIDSKMKEISVILSNSASAAASPSVHLEESINKLSTNMVEMNYRISQLEGRLFFRNADAETYRNDNFLSYGSVSRVDSWDVVGDWDAVFEVHSPHAIEFRRYVESPNSIGIAGGFVSGVEGLSQYISFQR